MFTLKDELFYIDYLKFRVRWIRDMSKSTTYSISQLKLPYTLFWLVLEGKLELMIHEEKRQVSTGDIVIFPPNTMFSLLPQQEEQPIRYLSLCGDLKIGNLDLVTVYDLPFISHIASSTGLSKLISVWGTALEAFEQLGELINGDKPRSEADTPHTHLIRTDISMQFLGMQGWLYQWLQHFLSVMGEQLPVEPLRFEERVMKVCQFIQHHIGSPLCLQDLADHVYLSPGYLSHLFLQSLGMPPMEYVRQMRIQTAKTMLMDSSYTIKEIAEKVGYEEQSQLSRAFRQAEGISPVQYRQSIQASITM
ncbi:AraC family transcriptional regulator [Paenibacillus sp. UNC451MF]|uniref:AraC family transcriptional regulator n=1 Tax=Paenibacillus sp. UNC451MF TaxID=1449063 RepID=UPI00048D9C38|nr:AraC family transcriptional regulator [Paenibacillus sp. UNC451MF]